MDNYRKDIEEKGTVCFYRRHANLKFANIDEAVVECGKQINLMKDFYNRN